MYDVIIVGSGPAGMTAAIYAARANMSVLMVEQLAPGGQVINTFEIQNYLGMGAINGAELAIKMFEHVQEVNVEFAYGTVKEITTNEQVKVVTCVEGESYEGKSVIIATGTKPCMLGVPHELDFAGNGISWCAICDGAHYKDKEVIVIGGGNSAVEEALYLSGMVKHLSIVTLFELTADPIACDKLRAMNNVTIHEFCSISEFLPGEVFTGLKARSTKTQEELIINAEGAFEYIGLNPNTEGFKALDIVNGQGYIVVDEWMQTAQKGVFAAGDVTAKNLRQVVTACNDGAIAAQRAFKYIEALKNKIIL